MDNGYLIITIGIFGLAFWLGLYLIGRDWRSAYLRLAGGGLVVFAIGVSLDLVSSFATDSALTILLRLRWVLMLAPALLWTGSFLYLLPAELSYRKRLIRLWLYGLVPITIIYFVIVVSTDWFKSGESLPYQLSLGLILMPLTVINARLWEISGNQKPKTVWRFLLISATLFAFSSFSVSFFYGIKLHPPLLGLLGGALLLLGGTVAVLDAFEQGESLVADLLRSFDFAFFTALLFGGQVGAVIIFGTGLNLAMLLLLLAVIATAILIQTFAGQLVQWLDKIALAKFPQVRQAREELRVESRVLTRVNPSVDLEGLDELEFTRMTRRALSHFGDLPHLATNPLTHLPAITVRLASRHAKDEVLERAAELKLLLSEAIAKLKPRDKGDFGTSDEWRYYNALYFPYVVGLKPYSQRASNLCHNAAAKAALEWFRTSVPERTLYNWQTTATKLIAHDLRQFSPTVQPEVAKKLVTR